jgi:preprotein translocase subunit YajC
MLHAPLSIWISPLAISLQEAAPGGGAGQGGQGSPLTGFLPFILIIGIFYLLVIRPESRKRKEHQAMLAALEKGDKVITTSGIYAQVVQVQEGILTLQLADGLRVKAARWAVQARLGDEAEAVPAPDGR